MPFPELEDVFTPGDGEGMGIGIAKDGIFPRRWPARMRKREESGFGRRDRALSSFLAL